MRGVGTASGKVCGKESRGGRGCYRDAREGIRGLRQEFGSPS